MKVTAIMATCGRHRCCERSLSFFLGQTYKDKHLLIYQNSEIGQSLHEGVDPTIVTLVNNHLDLGSSLPYKSLGAIYNDAITFINWATDIVIFWDDDDIFLPNHIEEGVKGLVRSRKTAYKPQKSFYTYDMRNLTLVENVLEPSIFVKAEHIYQYGFSESTTDRH